MKALFIALFVLLTCCQNKSIYKEKDLIGLSESEVRLKFGKPNNEQLLLLSSDYSLMEYQTELYQIVFNLNKGDTIKVKEMLWLKDNGTLAIWLKQNDDNLWLCFDNLKWSKDVEF